MNNLNNYTRNTNRKYSYNNYNNTSEAFKYAPNYEPEYNPSTKRRIKKKIKERYVNVEKKERYLSARFFVTLSIIISVAICSVSISATIIKKRFQIDELTSQLQEIKEENKNLETQIAKNLDLEYVEAYATEILKMQKPASHQIQYISVPKESYTVKNENIETENKGIFENFNFFNLFNILK